MTPQLALDSAPPAVKATAARVYYEDEFATLWCGDCRDVLPTIERGSVGLLATDPPYGIEYRSNFGGGDAIAGDDGTLDVPAIVALSVDTMNHGRHAYVFGFTVDHLAAVESLSAGVDLLWDKGAPGMGDLSSMWGPSTEPLAFAVYRPSKAERAQGRGRLAARMRRGVVLRVPRNTSPNADHPTGKPVALMRQIIESSSLVGDVVLDPFAGAGSTLVAAVVSGRQAIGIELEEKYCERAARRLRAARTLRLALEAM